MNRTLHFIIYLVILAALSIFDIRAMKKSNREIIPYLALVVVAAAVGTIFFMGSDQVSMLSRVNNLIRLAR